MSDLLPATPTTDERHLCALRCAMAVYDAEIFYCPRSPEWKQGARAGCLKAFGLEPPASAWASGTAQDDARNAGFHVGHALARAAMEQAHASLREAAL